MKYVLQIKSMQAVVRLEKSSEELSSMKLNSKRFKTLTRS